MSLTVRLSTIKSIREINEESASEEPYVLVTAVQLRNTLPGLPSVQNVRVFRYGVWEDFDEGEVKNNSGPPFWGLNSTPEDITDLSEVSFIISLMENDNADPGQYQTLLETVAAGSLALTLGEPDKSVRFSRLLTSIRNALNGIDLPIPFVLDDDHIGTEELRLDNSDLIPVGAKDKSLRITSSEGDYELTFRIERYAWLRFANLGGVFDGQPASVSWGPGHLEIFIHGNDGAIWHKWWDNGWSGWESLGGNFPNGEISAISWGVGHIEVFVRGHDNAIWHKWWNNGWFGWESLGGELASPPSGVTWGPGHIEVFARGFDNAIWHKWWNNGWFGWESLGGGLVGRPSAVSWGPGHIEVFAQAPDNAIWHKWWNNGWFGWESLGGGLASSPSAVTWGPGHIEVFAFTADGHVWHKWWNNGWFGWEDIGGVFAVNSQISPESWGVGHLEIFVKGNDNALWHKWWNNGWFGWENLGGDFSSSPNAISWGTGHLNVFVKDNSGVIWQTWWNNDHWGG
jgi:hypothetical protein